MPGPSSTVGGPPSSEAKSSTTVVERSGLLRSGRDGRERRQGHADFDEGESAFATLAGHQRPGMKGEPGLYARLDHRRRQVDQRIVIESASASAADRIALRLDTPGK